MSLSLLALTTLPISPNHTRLFACVLLWFYSGFAFACTVWFSILFYFFDLKSILLARQLHQERTQMEV